MNHSTALNQYKSVGVQSGVADASPHQLISMLLKGALDRMAAARGAIERNETARKGELIGRAIEIIDNLRASLDHQQGGEIAGNLASLYDFAEQSLMQASLESDIQKLDEAAGVLKEILSGWEGIAAEVGG